MPAKIENDKVRNIALVIAEGRQSAVAPLGSHLATLAVGDVLALDENDLALWKDETPHIVASAKDGATFTKEQTKIMRGLLGALQREARKVTKNDKLALQSRYIFVKNDKNEDVPTYAVERTV